jgi:hypothetical protein
MTACLAVSNWPSHVGCLGTAEEHRATGAQTARSNTCTTLAWHACIHTWGVSANIARCQAAPPAAAVALPCSGALQMSGCTPSQADRSLCPCRPASLHILGRYCSVGNSGLWVCWAGCMLPLHPTSRYPTTTSRLRVEGSTHAIGALPCRCFTHLICLCVPIVAGQAIRADELPHGPQGGGAAN